ncbi:hypothetical protein LTR09_012728 [Extremus antarcticus]|uniref:Chromo domain-containing protein n=1 Tax=Extremus antarcticus TaxID=702011 RepID=A0AAJ0D4K5_9PEZI|nr:hypothetical protein LTR09_012728 [Extremus antarcticus]
MSPNHISLPTIEEEPAREYPRTPYPFNSESSNSSRSTLSSMAHLSESPPEPEVFAFSPDYASRAATFWGKDSDPLDGQSPCNEGDSECSTCCSEEWCSECEFIVQSTEEIGPEPPASQHEEDALHTLASAALEVDEDSGETSVSRKRMRVESPGLIDYTTPDRCRIQIPDSLNVTVVEAAPVHDELEMLKTPVSPIKRIVDILAEKHTGEGRLYKVMWQDSWVHESRIPDAHMIRLDHYRRYGRVWDVLS